MFVGGRSYDRHQSSRRIDRCAGDAQGKVGQLAWPGPHERNKITKQDQTPVSDTRIWLLTANSSAAIDTPLISVSLNINFSSIVYLHLQNCLAL